ncbi:response regulator transcription factor [Saccharibacillus sp. JS10]|uniref:response regulator transcription factor n=1 Tax=Saccharibacillus sp. JS10 TaxID=2950552 RepID=UPI002109116A|nr:response regulator transcription factor [Saccharibacillus sp. JS10]MCQ4085712.1 response regulator transcription factor [Saccharibacillus sp. JS10]
MQTILIIEDQEPIARVLAAYLKKAGFGIERVSDGKLAIEQFEQTKPALVLLDIMLPGIDGWELLEEIRKRGSCPVIMLTALGDIDYRLNGLNGGADDYMTKPFVPEEVVARVHAVLRRRPMYNSADSTQSFGELMIDSSAQRVLINGAEVPLTPRDMSLLIFLSERPNQIFTREQLIEHVWGIDYDGSDRAVDLSIKRLRQALSHWNPENGEIRTLRGTGYQFWIAD